jgi:glycosyltransferase involved in cell wall biosynthesis
MNVTFLAEKLDRTGGSSFSLNLLASRLCDRGHSITILTTNLFQENDVPETHQYKIVDNVIESSSRYAGFLKIPSVLRQYESTTDIYHIFNPQHLAVAGLYRKSGNTPTVGRLNAYDAFCTNPGVMNGTCYKNCSLTDKIRHDDRKKKKKLIRSPQYVFQHLSPRLINYLDCIFAQSPAIKNVYSYNGIAEDSIDIVTNFYDPNFTQQSSTEENMPSNNIVILYVGRLRPEKGVDLLIDAAKELDMSNISINIIGGGPMREELEAQATNAGLSKSIRFHGWVDHSNLPRYYKKSDIFVHPGKWPEPSGRTILEALQYDCPVVVSDIGGPPWIAGDAGKTFEPNDASDLSQTINELQNPETLLEYTVKCEEVIQRFKPKNIISDIERKYTSLLK